MYKIPGKGLTNFWAKLPTRQRAAIVIAIPAVCIAITLAGWIWSRDSNLMVQQQSDSTEQVIVESNTLLLEMLNAETGARGYIITRNEDFLAPYNQAIEQVPIELQKLDALLPDDTSAQSQRLQTISQMSQQRLDIVTEAIRLIQNQTSSDSSQIIQRVFEGKVAMDQLRSAIGEFQADERALLEQYKSDKNNVQQFTNTLLWSAVLVSIMGTGSALFLFSNLDQELRTRERLLRESRSMLQAIATHVVDGVIILDDDREIELFNPTASKMFGYEAIEVKGKRLNMLFADPILKSYEEDKKRRFVGSQQSKTMGLRKVGSPFPAEISISDLQVEDRLIVIIRDISVFEDAQAKLQSRADELVRLASVLAQTNNTLEDRNKELEQFAYVASHDLKAPLRAIANLSEWIEEDLSGQLPPENQHQMKLLRGRVMRMEALINGLLEYSRVGRSKTPVETVNVNDLIVEVLDSLDPPQLFNIKIQSNMPQFKTKRILLRQVFANLIGNAINHHPRADGSIDISCREQDKFYEFAVLDDGSGIAPEYHERIFTIFQTLQPRDTKESTGIGLAIVKKIVETEGGMIWVESQVDKGATFYFTWLKESLPFPIET
ncbi:MAG: CHASE3 domain-containing protein [Drouetiella hepatica Uher 2000/2452]|jgi:PAS domain S-box-containing protein|uniref:histidine kinase n=1 Tax=Drouetiella hepatica Uher 2000/2452 TaxID=904376 RepID=A0A951UNN5_9CYAN|nr:CHASE3 domain-containing protein [Drouetiella hepatica Uher 2000/2452]